MVFVNQSIVYLNVCFVLVIITQQKISAPNVVSNYFLSRTLYDQTLPLLPFSLMFSFPIFPFIEVFIEYSLSQIVSDEKLIDYPVNKSLDTIYMSRNMLQIVFYRFWIFYFRLKYYWAFLVHFILHERFNIRTI